MPQPMSLDRDLSMWIEWSLLESGASGLDGIVLLAVLVAPATSGADICAGCRYFPACLATIWVCESRDGTAYCSGDRIFSG